MFCSCSRSWSRSCCALSIQRRLRLRPGLVSKLLDRAGGPAQASELERILPCASELADLLGQATVDDLLDLLDGRLGLVG